MVLASTTFSPFQPQPRSVIPWATSPRRRTTKRRSKTPLPRARRRLLRPPRRRPRPPPKRASNPLPAAPAGRVELTLPRGNPQIGCCRRGAYPPLMLDIRLVAGQLALFLVVGLACTPRTRTDENTGGQGGEGVGGNAGGGGSMRSARRVLRLRRRGLLQRPRRLQRDDRLRGHGLHGRPRTVQVTRYSRDAVSERGAEHSNAPLS